MSKKMNVERTCDNCMHCLACHLWSNGAISESVAPKCHQFKPARYASLAELQDLYRMYKGELVPVRHGRWVHDDLGHTYCSECHERIHYIHCYSDEPNSDWDEEWDEEMPESAYCSHCGAKMDAKEESGK